VTESEKNLDEKERRKKKESIDQIKPFVPAVDIFKI
jgi:hypothetical protein